MKRVMTYNEFVDLKKDEIVIRGEKEYFVDRTAPYCGLIVCRCKDDGHWVSLHYHSVEKKADISR